MINNQEPDSLQATALSAALSTATRTGNIFLETHCSGADLLNSLQRTFTAIPNGFRII